MTVQTAQPQPEQRKRRTDLTTWATTLIAIAAFGSSVYSIRQSDYAQVINRQSQVNTWFDTAVNELSSTSPDVRMGGIFQLERIARDSVGDQPTVVSELAAFVREHAAADPSAGTSRTKCVSPPVAPGPDIQVAVTVIGRRRVASDGPSPLNLTNTCLAHLDLDGADLTNTDLAGSDLTGASLVQANLAKTDIASVQLVGANLAHTNLAGLNFATGDPLPSVSYESIEGGVGQTPLSMVGANLAGADLHNSILSGIDLTGADLAGANLSNAGLSGAVLSKADLTGANLAHAKLDRAVLTATHMEGVDLRTATLPDQSVLAGAYLQGATFPAGLTPGHIGTPPTGPFSEQSGTHGSPTFTNPVNANGPGPLIPAMATVQVLCRVYAPEIASANPDGWWYRIGTDPWHNYYAVANTFWNGDVLGHPPYTHNTDFNVPVCPANPGP